MEVHTPSPKETRLSWSRSRVSPPSKTPTPQRTPPPDRGGSPRVQPPNTPSNNKAPRSPAFSSPGAFGTSGTPQEGGSGGRSGGSGNRSGVGGRTEFVVQKLEGMDSLVRELEDALLHSQAELEGKRRENNILRDALARATNLSTNEIQELVDLEYRKFDVLGHVSAETAAALQLESRLSNTGLSGISLGISKASRANASEAEIENGDLRMMVQALSAERERERELMRGITEELTAGYEQRIGWYEKQMGGLKEEADRRCRQFTDGAKREIEKLKADYYVMLSSTEAELSASRSEVARLRRQLASLEKQLTESTKFQAVPPSEKKAAKSPVLIVSRSHRAPEPLAVPTSPIPNPAQGPLNSVKGKPGYGQSDSAEGNFSPGNFSPGRLVQERAGVVKNRNVISGLSSTHPPGRQPSAFAEVATGGHVQGRAGGGVGEEVQPFRIRTPSAPLVRG